MLTFFLNPTSYFYTRWIFLRMLGAIYLIAFWSFSVQMPGLIGENGILPVGEFLQNLQNHLGPQRYWMVPTLAWFDSSSTFLSLIIWGGILLSFLVIINLAVVPALVGLWVFYLSITYAGQSFMSFQWDILLLEVGFLALFFAPSQGLPRFSRERPPSLIVLWAFRWLLFRLYFSSGVVKLSSGDLSWRNLSALNFHYETQPLPNPFAWYVHQFPEWFQKVSVLGVFVIELVVPFFIFAPRRIRITGASLIGFFQFLIIITGNYTFFNWLTLSLCVLLLDDSALCHILPQSCRAMLPEFPQQNSKFSFFRYLMVAGVMVILFLGGVRMTQTLFSSLKIPPFVGEILHYTRGFHLVNYYGLFAVMTTSRLEIIVEGSDDGKTWDAYEFKYKPGNPKRELSWVAPHQPRLDWQMWFAALGTYRSNPWFVNLMKRLLEGSPEVLTLLEKNPFVERPPKYLRALLYEYRFTTPETRDITGEIWQREYKAVYFPPVSFNSN